MKFRNIDKRRHAWETPQEKQAKKAQERAALRLGRCVKAKAKRLEPFVVPLADAMCRALSNEALPRVEVRTMPDSDDIQPLGSVPMMQESWARYFASSFSRLRRWFRGFWSAPRFTHPAWWLLASRSKSWP